MRNHSMCGTMVYFWARSPWLSRQITGLLCRCGSRTNHLVIAFLAVYLSQSHLLADMFGRLGFHRGGICGLIGMSCRSLLRIWRHIVMVGGGIFVSGGSAIYSRSVVSVIRRCVLWWRTFGSSLLRRWTYTLWWRFWCTFRRIARICPISDGCLVVLRNSRVGFVCCRRAICCQVWIKLHRLHLLLTARCRCCYRPILL